MTSAAASSSAVAVLPISVCLIVRDERDRMEACLAPLIGRFAQIIVYDNGSTDGTVEYLKGIPAVTLIEGPWLGFSATRRAVWQMASSPWILWLDADEILTEEIISDLSRVGSEDSIDGYRLNRQIIFEGQTIRHGEWFPDRVLRVFRTDRWTMPERAVHERVEVPGRVTDLKGVALHYSFRSWDDLQKRSHKYAQLWAFQAYQEHKKAAWPLLRAFARFLRAYFIKSGWLDGAIGYKIALHNAREVFHKYQLLNRARANGGVVGL